MTPWDRALAAEHAAIFAYGLIGAQLTGDAVNRARTAETAHRTRRDELILRSTGSDIVPAQAAYEVPFPVTDQASALRLAAEVEERSAAVWRDLLAATEGPQRESALTAMIEYAVRATQWRQTAGSTPVVPTWPGRPD
ncbi:MULTISPECIES: ferritin-like domain-containing protein [unclassified Solwaraspora]|uniref:ferritin-like domain-containing protein n=1 Tax=unclassified Solwaraspora TaxID=2627926 RepID=UPI00259BC3C5|nr:ferritin-like domain-containing protein [Solwaraspora sp. WMMA2056]WJK39935.1 ferritin-like domain-containing protein [Solwaraspora sp. WMMA2056]